MKPKKTKHEIRKATTEEEAAWREGRREGLCRCPEPAVEAAFALRREEGIHVIVLEGQTRRHVVGNVFGPWCLVIDE